MVDSSSGVVSEYDHQEVDNAVNQIIKEISQRYGFKGMGASITFSGETIIIATNSPERALAVYDVLQAEFVHHGVSFKSLDVGDSEPKQSSKEYKLVGTLERGSNQENTKKLSKLVRDEGPRGIRVQIQGGELRVPSKSCDALQEMILLLEGMDVGRALRLQSYRRRLPGPSKAGRSIAGKPQNWSGHSKTRRGNS